MSSETALSARKKVEVVWSRLWWSRETDWVAREQVWGRPLMDA